MSKHKQNRLRVIRKIMDAMENGDRISKDKLIKRCVITEDMTHGELSRLYGSHLVSKCVAYVQDKHRKGKAIHDIPVADFPVNLNGEIVPQSLTTKDEAKFDIARLETNNNGRIQAEADRVREYERIHNLSAEAKRRRVKLDQFIFSSGV